LTTATEILEQFVTQRRLERIDAVLASRTRNLLLVLENVHDPHNQAACMRSAEALGLQEVHVVGREGFSPNHAVVQGADKWVDLERHKTPARCVDALKKRGFTVAAAALRPDAVPISSIDFAKPTALAFGNEHDGLSGEFLDLADLVFVVPMLGFTQSFNISVSAAISLHHAVGERVRKLGSNGDLEEADRLALREKWLHLSVPLAEQVVAEMEKREGKGR